MSDLRSIVAAARELREETGLSGEFPVTSPITGVPRGLIGYEEHITNNKNLHINFIFIINVPTDAVTPNDEFEEWRWADSMEGLPAPENVGQLLDVALAVGRPR